MEQIFSWRPRPRPRELCSSSRTGMLCMVAWSPGSLLLPTRETQWSLLLVCLLRLPCPLLSGELVKWMIKTSVTPKPSTCYMQRWGRSDSYTAEESFYANSWVGLDGRWCWMKTAGDLIFLKKFSGEMEREKELYRQHKTLMLHP